MDIDVLTNEINTDPLVRGYSGMSDEQVAVDLNTVYRTKNRALMSGSEVWEATDLTEYDALSTLGDNNEQMRWIGFCGIESHDPFGNSAQFVINLFGAGSATVISLQDLRVDDVTRGGELGIGFVKPGNVGEARS